MRLYDTAFYYSFTLTLTLSLCSAANMLKYPQHCSGDTMALISSSVGRRKSGFTTHQLESIPVDYDEITKLITEISFLSLATVATDTRMYQAGLFI